MQTLPTTIASAVGIAFLLALVVKTLVQWFAEPLFVKYKVDRIWLRYVAGVFGFAISFLGGLDILPVFPEVPILTRFVSALVIGGGANVIHDIIRALELLAKGKYMEALQLQSLQSLDLYAPTVSEVAAPAATFPGEDTPTVPPTVHLDE